MQFAVKLAGVPIGLSVFYERTRELFREYMTQEEPRFSLQVTGEDLLQEAELTRERKRRIPGEYPQSREDLENQWLYHRIAENLLEYGALLFHGSAVAVDGEAYLFAAPSGVGKSTHARLWMRQFGERAVMVNDDKVFLRCGSGGVAVYGSPWRGKHRLGRNLSVPLRAIALLSRASACSVASLSLPEAFPRLLGQCYRHKLGEEKTKMVMRLLEQIGGQTALYDLRCNTEPDAARMAYEKMGRKGLENAGNIAGGSDAETGAGKADI